MPQGMTIDFEWLRQIHDAKRLRLATTVGLDGSVHIGGCPQLLVSELIRLAEIGQKLEQRTAVRVLAPERIH